MATWAEFEKARPEMGTRYSMLTIRSQSESRCPL